MKVWPIFADSIEAQAKTSEQAADDLVSATPELQELFKRADSLDKERALSELLEQAVGQRWSLISDSLHEPWNLDVLAEAEAVKPVSKYLDMPWAHTPRLTNYLAANLIATIIGEARNRLGWQKSLLKALFPSLWAKFGGTVVSVLIFSILMGLCIFFFEGLHSIVLGSLVIAFMLWNYGGNLLLNLKMRSFCGTLHLIAVEIDTGQYDREETIRRLRRIDDDRLIRFAVPSLVYALLRLSEPQRTPTRNVGFAPPI